MNKDNSFSVPLPESLKKYSRGVYNKFPVFTLNTGLIDRGYTVLAERITEEGKKGLRVLGIDGFNGVDWKLFRKSLNAKLRAIGVNPTWISMAECILPEETVFKTVEPFLGGNDPLFGRHFPLGADLFFDPVKVAELRWKASDLRAEGPGDPVIFYGWGTGLLEILDSIWYLDIPKDSLQSEARKGRVRNLGNSEPSGFGDFYKRSYFVDWPVLNRLKRRLLPNIDLLIDLKNPGDPVCISGIDFRAALHEISGQPFRVRPWFSPGPWGGKYMQGHMGLDPEQPNFAWSFESIVPENGIVLERKDVHLEFSFDWLMFQENRRVLGKAAGMFGYEWPIRFDYLDTIDGGKLSTQVHPRPEYIRKNFGETYTQDETYYIVNSKGDSRVYLGLKDLCEPENFKSALLESAEKGTELDMDCYVSSVPSKPHDLFLIPNGTVHCSGTGNMVLEISATPYIFTFKIYDYLRKDLEGNYRTLNIERAFENIHFERSEAWVTENLLRGPEIFKEGRGWIDYILYDKPFSFYNIHRIDFTEQFDYETEDRGLTINLVEGESIEITGENGSVSVLSLYETMIVPAAAGSLNFRNIGSGMCRLILVYVKPGAGQLMPLNTPS